MNDMADLLWIIPALPFLGALLLIIFGRKFSRSMTSAVGVGSVGLSALLVMLIGFSFMSTSAESYRQVLWQWIDVEGFSPAFAFHLDALSLVFIFVITFVGFLIH